MTKTFALLGLALAPLVAAPAGAKPYPANTCVSSKQETAGDYCKHALKAWAAGSSPGRRRP